MRRHLLISVLAFTGCFSAVNEPWNPDGGAGGGSGGGTHGTGGGTGGTGGTGGGAQQNDCEQDLECGRGMVCEACGGKKSCAPGCRSDADCARPTTCQTGVVCKTCPCAQGFCAIDPCLDVDGDGFVAGFGSTCSSKRGGDCDDTNRNVNPAAVELCSNGLDDDCDGKTDRNDPQCVSCSGGAGCSNALQCSLGLTYCDKGTGGMIPACCAQCPSLVTTCAQGFSAEPDGLDPMTGCAREKCVPDNVGCPAVYLPVCGVNGQTYGNRCELNRAMAEWLHDGECVRGEGLDCGFNGPESCGTTGQLYCRDACPICDAWVMRCTKVGVCVSDLDCPAGAPPPPFACPDGSQPRATCGATTHTCSYGCP